MDSINLTRKNGSSIENEFYRIGSKYLGVVLSGFGYTYKNTLLYYSKRVLQEKGIDYWGIDYKYYGDQAFLKMSEIEKDKYFEDDNTIVVDMIDELSDKYEKIILIGKSMGTSIIRRYIRKGQHTDKSIYILITPGTEWSDMINDLKEIDNTTLIIGSLEDHNYIVKNLSDIYEKKNLRSYEIQHGNHLLETNNVQTDIDVLKKIIIEISKFIDEEVLGHNA